jgi:hypothetical protein
MFPSMGIKLSDDAAGGLTAMHLIRGAEALPPSTMYTRLSDLDNGPRERLSALQILVFHFSGPCF